MLAELLADQLRSAASLSLLLDYDGTLVPLPARPELAAPDDALLSLLRQLAARPRTRVTIVSGRDADSIERWLAVLPIPLVAEHGLLRRSAHDRRWTANAATSDRSRDRAIAELEQIAARRGGIVERKRGADAWHYRGVDITTDLVAEIGRDLIAKVEPLEYEVIVGACVIEVRPRGVNKGIAVRRACADDPDALIVAIGDDVTDDDMFLALRSNDVRPRGRERALLSPIAQRVIFTQRRGPGRGSGDGPARPRRGSSDCAG